MKHPTKILNLPVEVDRKIVPLVLWMNSLPRVRTLYCCQGDRKNQPYIMFRCFSKKSLNIIRETLDVERTVTYKYGQKYANKPYVEKTTLECRSFDYASYSVDWPTKAALKKSMSFLPRG